MKKYNSLLILSIGLTIWFGTSSFTSVKNMEATTTSINTDKISDTYYCVCFGEFEDMIPIKIAKKIGEIKGASSVNVGDGIFRFYSPLFETTTQLDRAIQKYNEMGLTNLIKMVAIDGSFYTEQEFATL